MWMCGASNKGFQLDRSECYRDVMDNVHMPVPFPEYIFKPKEWPHILATLDVCTLPYGTQFYNLEGPDIIPIHMIQPC